MWDVFISHASEDKDEVVKPLANALKAAGVKVWYDEFELRLGDSLSRSIDKGLRDSKYGIVILSSAFFEKKWTEYEFRSLVAKDISGKHVILPIWHKISLKQVQEYSLFLSDLFGLSTEKPMPELAVEILKTIRPDILNNHLMMEMGMKLRKNSKQAEVKRIPHSDIYDNPHPHTTLPAYLVISCRLISEVFQDVADTNFINMLENFAKDYDYLHEFMVWSVMANAYVAFIRETHCPVEDIEKKKEAFELLLTYSLGYPFKPGDDRFKRISEQEQMALIVSYANNHQHINAMLDKMT